MVQKEVGERLAAAPRLDAYGAVSVKVAYWATAAVVGLVPAVGVPARARTSSRRWSGSSAARARPVDVDRDGAVPLVRHGVRRSAARCCAVRWPAW